MKKIYLFCSAGMSTSMLASKMQNVAKANNFPVEVKAFSHSKIEQIVNEEHPDVILLGPQVKHLLAETKEKYESQAPVAVIDADDYGMMRGDKVLKSALLMMKKKQ
ncbi:PTS sugar transporter subunit IIB [Erysipelotrichaceae bacterium HCN-30851]